LPFKGARSFPLVFSTLIGPGLEDGVFCAFDDILSGIGVLGCFGVTASFAVFEEFASAVFDVEALVESAFDGVCNEVARFFSTSTDGPFFSRGLSSTCAFTSPLPFILKLSTLLMPGLFSMFLLDAGGVLPSTGTKAVRTFDNCRGVLSPSPTAGEARPRLASLSVAAPAFSNIARSDLTPPELARSAVAIVGICGGQTQCTGMLVKSGEGEVEACMQWVCEPINQKIRKNEEEKALGLFECGPCRGHQKKKSKHQHHE
jgi:hypothetical protein